ncbi:MAG: TIGR03790 family protein [Pseudomonadota bacterium]|nr:TIGR03790 family protein [Pseudomonadota bacterium]
MAGWVSGFARSARPVLAAALLLLLTCASPDAAMAALALNDDLAQALPDSAAPNLSLPPIGLKSQDLALIVNDADPASVEIGRYYASRRGIAAERVVHVSFPAGQVAMSAADFERVQAVLQARVPAAVQAYALAWTLPYRVECMSVTSAFAFGFDRSYCAVGCQITRPSAYFDSPSNAPFKDHGLRPAMLLAGRDVAGVKAMIDRGVRSDQRWPAGTGYLLSTSDRKRNVRAETYDAVRRKLIAAYPMTRINADALEDRPDVMFYFTGVQRVAGMNTNRYLDGAVADHLTSVGGMLTDSSQTSALEWLAAGATGSYGNTTEPCNYREKFPDIGVVMGHYLGGETLIEAYWKSVRMPGQGVFVGEPLARPFGGMRVSQTATEVAVQTRLLRPGAYVLQSAPGRIGPFRTVGQMTVPGYGVRELRLPVARDRSYRVLQVPVR